MRVIKTAEDTNIGENLIQYLLCASDIVSFYCRVLEWQLQSLGFCGTYSRFLSRYT